MTKILFSNAARILCIIHPFNKGEKKLKLIDRRN
jgi:hypothetical protein